MMKKKIEIPVNWQDFEDLCKELWRSEWKCREIQSHGRSGQIQYGVDVFGIPDGENEYYGIQCKLKTNRDRLTEADIEQEIDEAKKFPGPMKMIYIATTAPNDAKIQQYVMLKNINNRKNGLFGITIYSWQEISDLMRHHKKVYEWYLSEKFNQSSVNIYINDVSIDSKIITHPRYKKINRNYIYHSKSKLSKKVEESLKKTTQMLENSGLLDETYLDKINFVSSLNFKNKINKSLVEFKINIDNTGDEALENFYLVIEISDSDYSKGIHFQNNEVLINPESEIDRRDKQYWFDGDNEIINSGMSRRDITIICLPKEETCIELSYNFYSKKYRREGKIIIQNRPIYEEVNQMIPIFNKEEEKTEVVIEYIIIEEERNIMDFIR